MPKQRAFEPVTNTGGGGYRFEHCVIAHFYLIMLTSGMVPGFNEFEIQQVIPQCKGKIPASDFPNTDDIMLIGKHNSKDAKILISVKSDGDSELNEVISRMYQDYSNTKCASEGVVGFIYVAKRFHGNRDFMGMSEFIWARGKTEEFSQIPTTKEQSNAFNTAKQIIMKVDKKVTDVDCQAFLQKVILLQLDFRKGADNLAIGSTLASDIDLISTKQKIDHSEARRIWAELYDQASNNDAIGRGITIAELVNELDGWRQSDQSSTAGFVLPDDVRRMSLFGSIDLGYEGDLGIVKRMLGDK